jgi:hypothetical protein
MAVLVMEDPPFAKALASTGKRESGTTVPAAIPIYATARPPRALAEGFCGDHGDAIWLSLAFGHTAADHHSVVADHRPPLTPVF